MTLDSIYRDIYSRIRQSGLEHDFGFLDIVKAINDAIRQLRFQYIETGNINDFLLTEDIVFVSDSTFRELNSGVLTSTPIQDAPVSLVFSNIRAYKTQNELEDSTQSYTKGDLVYREGVLYKATKTSSSLNTYNLVFDPKKVRNYKRNNGLQYYNNDVIYDSQTDDYYRVNADFVANVDVVATSIPELTVLYWKEMKEGWLRPQVLPYKNLQQYTILGEEFYPFVSFLGDTIYTNNYIEKITISYVPVWSDVTDMTTDLGLPDSFITQVKILSIQLLAGANNERKE